MLFMNVSLLYIDFEKSQLHLYLRKIQNSINFEQQLHLYFYLYLN